MGGALAVIVKKESRMAKKKKAPIQRLPGVAILQYKGFRVVVGTPGVSIGGYQCYDLGTNPDKKTDDELRKLAREAFRRRKVEFATLPKEAQALFGRVK